MRVVLDGRDPSDRAPVGPRQEVLRLGMLEERVLARREQGTDVHPQLRYPQPVAAIVVVGEGDELRETAPVRDGRDLRKAQMTPSSLPSRANTSNAWSICCDVCVAIRLVRSRQCDGGTAGGTTGLGNTPASNSVRQNRKGFSSGPRGTGPNGGSGGPGGGWGGGGRPSRGGGVRPAPGGGGGRAPGPGRISAGSEGGGVRRRCPPPGTRCRAL